MARDVHSLSQVEAMGREALDAGVEVQLLATPLPCLVDEPVEKLLAVSVGAMRSGGHEIVDIQEPPPGEVLEEAIPGDGDRQAFVLDERQLIARFHLPTDARYEVVFCEVRSELLEDRETAQDFLVGPSVLDRHFPTLANGTVRCKR